MQKTIKEIATLVKGTVIGSEAAVVTGFSGIKEAQEGDLTFLANPKYIVYLQQTKASAVLVNKEVSSAGTTLIQVENPSAAFARIMSSCLDEEISIQQGVHEKALVSSQATLSDNVTVGPYAVIEEGVQVGPNTIIEAGCYIGHKTSIGANCHLYPNITVRERIVIGDRVLIHSGTVIGGDGFGYVQVEGVHQKIPQVGTVVIEDDVEIGANVTIDRARFDKTTIGQNTKIDNLVQIAHNDAIGKSCIIIAQCGISGSTVIEDNCILAGQVGVVGHITIGKNSVVAARGMVTKSLKEGTMYSGVPVSVHNEAKRINACVKRLPHYVKIIQEMKSKIEALEAQIEQMKG
jgi:UDP-3-O-[3-hydroxymyristoyl] glucosamine N-acyltransferase